MSNYCIGWGALRGEEGSIHMDCPVVLTRDTVWQSAVADELLAGQEQFPADYNRTDCEILRETMRQFEEQLRQAVASAREGEKSIS